MRYAVGSGVPDRRRPGAFLNSARQVAARLDPGSQRIPGGPAAGRILQHTDIIESVLIDTELRVPPLHPEFSGAYIPDEGEVLINGRQVTFESPMDARRQGIEMVYQDYALANNLDVAANVFM